VQGFGNAGSIAAELLAAYGARVIAVCDTRGGIYKRDGLDIPAVLLHKKKTGTVAQFPGASAMDSRDLLELQCDVLIPAALENQITMENADRVQARIVAEAANGPTTPAADHVLHDRGIMVLPDILANAGGVTVSYFEWVQDLQELFWTEAEVNQKLEKVMVKAFEDVHSTATRYSADLRTWAYILAIDRVATATRVRGIWP